MNLMFWKSPKPRVVTQAINRHLNSEFGMGSELLAKLRMLEKNGKFSDRKVRMVRVFDPELVSASAGSKLKFEDLKGTANEGALRFEGRFEKDGSLFMSDRRPRVASAAAEAL